MRRDLISRPEAIVLKSFDNCFEGLAIDENSYVVIVTRGHQYNKIVLEAYTLAESEGLYSPDCCQRCLITR